MKKLIMLLLLCGMVAISAQATLPWYHNINKAIDDAAQSGRLIFVDVYTEWCSWCKKLDKETFQDKSFKQISAKFVLLKVDGDAEYEFCTRYKVRAYPTMLFLKADGKEVKRVKGYLPADKLVPIMQDVLTTTNRDIYWYKDIDAAFRAAKAKHQRLFVDVYTEWCGWCKKLDKETFSQPAFHRAAAPFILLKVDGDAHSEFLLKYKVRAYPTMLIINDNGEAVRKIVGFLKVDRLVPIMKEYSSK